MEFQRAVLFLLVLQIHYGTLVAGSNDQKSSFAIPTRRPSSRMYSDVIGDSGYVISVPKKPKYSDNVYMDNSDYQEFSEHGIPYSDEHPYIFDRVLTRKSPKSRRLRRPRPSSGTNSDDTAGDSGYVITIPQRKSRHSDNEYADGSSRRYIITMPRRKPQTRIYSDAVTKVPPKQYSDTVVDSQRSHYVPFVMLSSAYAGSDEDDPEGSHREEVETVVKCPQGTELSDDGRCEPTLNDNDGTEIKKVVKKPDIYLDESTYDVLHGR